MLLVVWLFIVWELGSGHEMFNIFFKVKLSFYPSLASLLHKDITSEAMSGWGWGKVFLDIIFKL